LITKDNDYSRRHPFPQGGLSCWAVLNREADYTAQLRETFSSPIFSVSGPARHWEDTGKQISALLPEGASVLYIQGPSVSSVSRFEGLQETLHANVQLVTLRGTWTAESAYQSVSSWMKLMKASKTRIDLIGGQNDGSSGQSVSGGMRVVHCGGPL
jgi:hypothetical protein